ncbi:MAG: 2,3-bisphosphoglycerate-independent phosphoglycerate mutase [Bacilli bacterium]|jgi:2,3-bisphosphoglycerate-independent phosphoglycerate mutase|nr:2,3-bisphosphoglycerate-independent phosphoglycerate mutase [Bacilli bacterium]
MKKILTIILDGFGMREEVNGNAISLANPENFNQLWKKYPHALLHASEEYVGLEKNQFGNSEVGHLTIGAGRKIKQPMNQMKDFIENDMSSNEMFLELVDKIKEEKKRVHLMGLFSDGKVHSDISQIIKVYQKLILEGVTEIYFHIITDGRDTNSKIAYQFIKQIEDEIEKNEIGKIATVCGRYYAMDRDHKWERTEKYYELITKGVGLSTIHIENTIEAFYEKNITDEFLEPIIVNKNGLIQEQDVLIWLNYRTDRARQILSPFVNVKFEDFKTEQIYPEVYTFVPIDKTIKTNHFLEDNIVSNPLGIYLSKLGLTQARIAETEKFAHVTFFFDGEYNGAIEGANKYLIPSPKVATYDMKPEMNAVEVTKKVIACMEKDFDFILVNYANPDMVGHTGNLEAGVKAIMTVDLCLGKIMEEAEENFYKVIILADHGNADIMRNEKNEPVTTHTTSLVPFIITDEKVKLKEIGDLTQVAPTILEYMDIAIPKEMKETESLFEK